MPSRSLIPTTAEAELVVCDEGLSFWGGVDPNSGHVIDAHHPQVGTSLAGKIVMMPTSRGSCSGSGVLLELALNGLAPAALIFREEEEVLTLGALIGSRMFDRSIGVARLTATDYAALSRQTRARINATSISADGLAIGLHPIDLGNLDLTQNDIAILDGALGAPASLAMDVICRMAAAQGAKRLVDVTRGHIDGCIYTHEANLIFAETMRDMGAKVKVPTTINAISIDRENWQDHGLPPKFGDAASRLADAYVSMGAEPTFTCAPYLSDDAPEFGETIGWSESNAVVFANSVLGARTAKHPDYLDLFIAMTARAPETGVYLTNNRRPAILVDVDALQDVDDAFWPLLGWVAGQLAPDRVPRLDGLSATAPSRDDLRAACAAFGTTSAAPLLHIAGVTPESDLPPLEDAKKASITREDLLAAWQAFNAAPDRVDLVALGSPHLSLEEMCRFADCMGDRRVHPEVRVVLTLGRQIQAKAQANGVARQLQLAGVHMHADLCWCSMTEPVFPTHAKTIMTNSAKYAHYAPGLSGRTVRFGSLADCAEAAVHGTAPVAPPRWLGL